MNLSVIYLHLVLAPGVLCGRVLFVSMQFGSHLHEQFAVGRILMTQGHEVYTIIQDNFPPAYIDNLRSQGFHVLITKLPQEEEPYIGKYWNELMDKAMLDEKYIGSKLFQYSVKTSSRDCKLMVSDEEFMGLLKELDFHLALVDGFILSPCYHLIPHMLHIPFISMYSMSLPHHLGLPVLPSTTSLFVSQIPEVKNFWQRVQSSYLFFHLAITDNLMGNDYISNFALFEKHTSGISSWQQLIRKSCIFIQTRDHHLDRFMPSMPNFVQIPGITTQPGRTLDLELQSIYDNAKNGVVVFTMGSVIAVFPEKILQKIISVFKHMKQTIIMRYSADMSSIEIPVNVHIRSWLPQNDLLAQNKTTLFITHGGNNGQYESIYHGVPMISFPIFGDQFENAMRIEHQLVGKSLKFDSFTEEELKSAIDELLTNPEYKANAKRLSAILKDRPMLPAEEVAYWMNHVMKFGCEHLRSHVVDMPWYKLYMVDIISVFVSVFVISVLICYGCICKLLSHVRKPKSKHE